MGRQGCPLRLKLRRAAETRAPSYSRDQQPTGRDLGMRRSGYRRFRLIRAGEGAACACAKEVAQVPPCTFAPGDGEWNHWHFENSMETQNQEFF